MRLAVLLVFCLLSYTARAGGIKGKITAAGGQPLPYAGITARGTSEGTMANSEGIYEFALPAGNYEIVFQYLGFKSIVKKVAVTEAFTTLDITLEEQALNLPEASIGKDKEDPAYTVMRRAIAKARFHQLQIRGYTARVYSRSTGLPTKIPGLLEKRLKKEGVQEGKSILNESVAEIRYRRPNTYSQKIISTRNSFDNSLPSPNEYILASLYSPEIAGTISPLSPRAFAYYKFEYEGYFEEHGQVVNKIRVIPKAYGEGVFKGSIFILEDLWSIHSYDLQTTTSGLNIAAKQFFSPIQQVWVPVNQQFSLSGSYLGFAGEFRYLVSLTYQKLDIDPALKEQIQITDHKKEDKPSPEKGNNLEQLIAQQKAFSTRDFRKLTRKYEREQKKAGAVQETSDRLVREDSIVVDPLANKRDTAYWQVLRPVPLTQSEVASYVSQDSIQVVKTVSGTKARPDSLYFKPVHLATGNTYALGDRRTFYFKSPLLSISYNTVEGNAINFLTKWEKKWGKNSYFNVNPLIRYSFGRKRVYGNLETNVGNEKWNLMLGGGEMARQINNANPIPPLPNSLAARFFDRSFMKLYQGQYGTAEFTLRNIGDILSISGNVEYEHRKELFNQESARPIFFWNNYSYTPNRPVSKELANTGFPQHNALLFNLNAQIRPWRRYLIRNGEKRYLRSKGPSFGVHYKSAAAFGGDVAYDMLEGTIRQDLSLGPRSHLEYYVNGGGFLSTKKMYFPDYRHFMGNEFFFQYAYPPDQFRMLQYYRYSTDSWFFQAHAVWTMQHFLLTRVQALRVTGLSETLQLHYLRVPSIRNYSEVVYGLDDILRVIRLEAVAQFHGSHFKQMGFRVGTSIKFGR
ncbi:carboxypeptidase-like regulatory domain-containing protein [Dyadobacter sandarakinus]|uniref:Carboxypeptidase-like regulatory domain-containing protein n=2 Tax=Dyadobacter sandarakinus TaxID=2747268 RepID=A0ABX7IHK9_9BACT|nr:carboxypeptidase-like regulatory domain-containing protein [Dyadobacter sandarakinus]